VTVDGGTGGTARSATQQAADRFFGFFDSFVDRFAHGGFGAGDPFDDFFGDLGDAGAAERAAGRFVDGGDGLVDGAGDGPGEG